MKYRLLMDVTKIPKTSENCFEDHIKDLKFKFHFCTANQTALFWKYCDRSPVLPVIQLNFFAFAYTVVGLPQTHAWHWLHYKCFCFPSFYSIVLRLSYKDSGSQDMLGFSEKNDFLIFLTSYCRWWFYTWLEYKGISSGVKFVSTRIE